MLCEKMKIIWHERLVEFKCAIPSITKLIPTDRIFKLKFVGFFILFYFFNFKLSFHMNEQNWFLG